ncbi:MAG: PhzF family phenazine biosynthesis protein [Elusimicrobia bacterium]|nr:PhzF family phenazine biosynthesis protein [Elusimicrobiota bacterium]
MGLPVCAVDAFADKPFTGNPAAVVFLDGPRDDAWRQSVAAEFNLSETAFVEPSQNGFRLRWFTPTVEVSLCGHATLAAAHALWETGRLDAAAPARFETKSGILTARRDGDWIVLDLPSLPVTPAKPPPGLLAALADTPLAFLENDGAYLLEMDSEETVRRAAPNLAIWSALTKKGLILTAGARRATCDFVSRCFFPSDGIPEDPVTGSAHCSLGPYWSQRLNKPVLTAFQASKRGGFLLVRPKGARVEIGGRAVTAWTGGLA